MNSQFDRFSPDAWQESGILKPMRVPVRPSVRARTASALATAMVLSLASISTTPTSQFIRETPTSVALPHDGAGSTDAAGAREPLGGDFISPDSWPKLVAALDRLPVVVEQVEGPDPEPAF